MNIKYDRIDFAFGIFGKVPIIRGKNIEISDLIELVHQGYDREAILKCYPELEEEDFSQAFLFWSQSDHKKRFRPRFRKRVIRFFKKSVTTLKGRFVLLSKGRKRFLEEQWNTFITNTDFKEFSFTSVLAQVSNLVHRLLPGKLIENHKMFELLPERMRAVYHLCEMHEMLFCDGYFSVFYNNTLRRIQEIRKAIEMLDYAPLTKLFHDAFDRIRRQFEWKSEDTNIISQLIDDEETSDLEAYFGEELTTYMNETQSLIWNMFEHDEALKHRLVQLITEPGHLSGGQ